MPYIGKSSSFGVRNRFVYVMSTSGGTSISGADANGATLTFTDGAYVDVYLNGVLLKPTTDYNTSTANTIAGLSALNTNDEVTVVVYDIFTVADMVSATSGGTFSGNVTFNGDISVGDDLTFSSDGAVLSFGADADVTLTHVADQGLTLKSTATDGAGGVGPILNLSTGDTDITSANQLGTINFQAPNDDAGSDAQLVAASITAIAQSNFSSSSNATSLLLRSSNSGTNDGGYLEIKNDGDIRIGDGDIYFDTAGRGIVLGATSNTDANTLEDYEEGTFTPTFIGTSGSAGSHAFINTEGKYRKVGNLVYIFLFGNVTNVGSYSGNNRVGGLPFANATANIAPLVIGGDSQNASENAFTVNAGDNGGQLSDRFTQAAYAWSTIQAANSLIIAGTYPTS